MTDESEFIRHTPCEHCGSSDANSLYTDGHSYCFACETYTPADKTEEIVTNMDTHDTAFLDVEFMELKKRGLTQKTCEFWGYGVSNYRGQRVQVANYRDATGKLQAQKLRFANKDFSVVGNLKKSGLYGEHLWRDGTKFVVVTEGEIDAMSVSQVQDLKWPVVSLPSGCTSAKKAIGQSIEFLCTFDHVVIMFDNDEAGQKAAIEATQRPATQQGKDCKATYERCQRDVGSR